MVSRGIDLGTSHSFTLATLFFCTEGRAPTNCATRATLRALGVNICFWMKSYEELLGENLVSYI